GASTLRVFVTTGTGCGRTCVAHCAATGSGFGCERSELYVPFPDLGFGALEHRSRRTTNGLCGLAIDNDVCDFLIDERCILPYPSSHFLATDPSTPTGFRVSYRPTAVPATATRTQ